MWKFVSRVLVLVIILKLCDLLLAGFLSTYLETRTALADDYGSINRMYLGEIDADIVFFGSSRTSLQINPEVIQRITGLSAWNLGMGGSNFEQQEFTLEEYVLHNKTPAVVVFEADVLSLDPSLLRFDTQYFLPYRNDSPHTLGLFGHNWDDTLYYWLFSSAIFKHEIPTSLADYGLVIRKMRGLNAGAAAPPPTTILKVEGANETLVNGAQLKAGQVPGALPERLPLASPTASFDLTKANTRAAEFEKLAQYAHNQGFVLVLLFPPYMNGQVGESQRRFATDFYARLARNHADTYFLDYSQYPRLANDLDYWWDESHLNITGADILSEELGGALTQILQQ